MATAHKILSSSSQLIELLFSVFAFTLWRIENLKMIRSISSCFCIDSFKVRTAITDIFLWMIRQRDVYYSDDTCNRLSPKKSQGCPFFNGQIKTYWACSVLSFQWTAQKNNCFVANFSRAEKFLRCLK